MKTLAKNEVKSFKNGRFSFWGQLSPHLCNEIKQSIPKDLFRPPKQLLTSKKANCCFANGSGNQMVAWHFASDICLLCKSLRLT